MSRNAVSCEHFASFAHCSLSGWPRASPDDPSARNACAYGRRDAQVLHGLRLTAAVLGADRAARARHAGRRKSLA